MIVMLIFSLVIIMTIVQASTTGERKETKRGTYGGGWMRRRRRASHPVNTPLYFFFPWQFNSGEEVEKEIESEVEFWFLNGEQYSSYLLISAISCKKCERSGEEAIYYHSLCSLWVKGGREREREWVRWRMGVMSKGTEPHHPAACNKVSEVIAVIKSEMDIPVER